MSEAEKETTRIEAFSDGIFAFAITLLALDLKVPRDLTSAAELATQLRDEATAYLSFVLSFLTILVIWVTHHGIFRRVRRVDGALIFLNGLILLLVAAVPFPTALLGEYLGDGPGNLAAAVYAIYYAFLSLAFLLLTTLLAKRRHQLMPALPSERVRAFTRRPRIALVGYLGAAVAALWSDWAMLAICLGIWGYWFTIAYQGHRIVDAPAGHAA